jgi:3-deoxy-D-manno-octulosonate 8-phosphate phosphatase (KDO 8-P phosphatase)
VARDRLKRIRLLALDVDGILTDGTIFWLKDQEWTRFWSVRDGHGLLMLAHGGFATAFITAGDSADVRARADRLKIRHPYFGVQDKLKIFEKILADEGLKPDQVAYMGDELMDIPVLERAGFSACRGISSNVLNLISVLSSLMIRLF